MLLLLTRTSDGRTWRLADTCHDCAAATAHAAVVREEPSLPRTPPGTQPAPTQLWGTGRGGLDEDALWWIEAPYD